MSRKRYAPEQIIGMLREAAVGLAQGEKVGLRSAADWEFLNRVTIAGVVSTAA